MTLELTCGYCGRPVSVDATDAIASVVAATACVVSCRACNLEKHDRTPSEWRPTGLPAWRYQAERVLAHRYKMKRRGPAIATVLYVWPGATLLRHRSPVCLELLGHREGRCGKPAEHEVSLAGGPWTARCSSCVRFYHPRCAAELTELQALAHILVQLEEGTLAVEDEATLIAIARLAGVSIREYVDLARRMVLGDVVVRDALKALSPALHLEMWGPAEREVDPS